MEIQWYAYVNGQQSGPYTWEELWRKTQAGEIGPADLVWNQSLSGWTRADQVPGLVSVQPAYPGAAASSPASFQAATAKKKSKGNLVVILVLALLVAGGGGAAYYFLTRNGDISQRNALGTGEGQQAAILPHNLPAPPGAVLAASNPAFGYYQFTIDADIEVDNYCANYQDMINEQGGVIISPVFPCQEDIAHFYIYDTAYNHLATVEIYPGRIEMIISP